MYKPLIYHNDIYLDYEINKKGKIRNSSSKYKYKAYIGKKRILCGIPSYGKTWENKNDFSA